MSNIDTDQEVSRYMDAQMFARARVDPTTIPGAIPKFNEQNQTNDFLVDLPSGGYFNLGPEPQFPQPEVMDAAPVQPQEASVPPIPPSLEEGNNRFLQMQDAMNTEPNSIVMKNEELASQPNSMKNISLEIAKGLYRGVITKPSQLLEDNLGIYDPLVLQVFDETGAFAPSFKLLSREEKESLDAQIQAGELPGFVDVAELMEFSEQSGAVAGVAGGFSQFLGAFVGLGKMFKFGKGILGSMKQGAAADFIAFGGDEGRISDLLAAFVPENMIPDFMLTDPNDPDYYGRMKTAIEGAGVGGILDVSIRGLGLLFRSAKHGDVPAEELEAALAVTESGLKQALRTAVSRLNQPGAMPTASSFGAGIFAPGQKIPPSLPAPTPAEILVARADTRQSAEIVAERLNVTVPETERVNGGVYQPGTPNGQKWSDLPPQALTVRGGGANFTDADLEQLWQETLSEVSEAAKNSVSETGATWQAFPTVAWDKALRLPNRSQLWYELSGEDFLKRLPQLTQPQHMMFLDIVGATSARAGPKENLERSLAVLSQNLRGVPVDVDLTITSTVTDALNRSGTNVSSDLANKTGMFSDTLGLVAGLPLRYPISVNDVWVGKAFGISDSQLSTNQSLHEVFGKYMNKVREKVNSGNLHQYPHESWQLQARQWVEMRAVDDGIDTSQNMSIQGNDYAGEFANVIAKLEDAGIAVPNGIITNDILMNPKFADALRATTPGFRDAPKATVEFGTLLTPSGLKGAELFETARGLGDQLTQKEYLTTLTSSMYHTGRGKSTIWEETVRLATGDSDKVTRIVSPTSENPFAISGTFEGAAAPNIRVPLKNMSPDQIAYFNAMAGQGLKQKAMASAEILVINPGEALPSGYVETSSIFFPWTDNVPEEMLTGISNALGDGFEISVAQYPNGLKVDVNPRFTDAGPEGPDADSIEAVGKYLEDAYNVNSIEEFSAAYKSEYGKNYVEDDGTGSAYREIIKTTLKGWKDEATNKIIELGVPKSIANQFISGKITTISNIDGKTSKQIQSIRGKASTIRKRLRSRVDTHDEKLKAWQDLGAGINARMQSQLPKWEKRLGKIQGKAASSMEAADGS